MAAGGKPAAAARGPRRRSWYKEDGPRHVARPPGVAAPAGGIEVPAHVGHHEARLAEA